MVKSFKDKRSQSTEALLVKLEQFGHLVPTEERVNMKVTQWKCRLSATPWTAALPRDSSVHGILVQARTLQHSLLQGIFPTRDRTQISCTVDRFFYHLRYQAGLMRF